MSKYFMDCEFLEGKQDKRFLGIKYGETKPTIDVISVGIVSEDNREYYAISKDFNLYEAWNRYGLVNTHPKLHNRKHNVLDPFAYKVYWIRENVLLSIYNELCKREFNDLGYNNGTWSFLYLKELINKYGKTNKQIAEEIKQFCLPIKGFVRDWYEEKNGKINLKGDFKELNNYEKNFDKSYLDYQNPEFYGYGQDKCFLFTNFLKIYG